MASCPITRGQPTRMTRASFDKTCSANKLAADDEVHLTNRHISHFSVCRQCSGLPPELEFINVSGCGEKSETVEKSSVQKEVSVSADKVKRANTLQCESCGKTAPRLYGNYGKQVCSPCQAMRGIAKANPAAVILSLREFGHQLGEQTAPDDHAHNAMAADLEGARERIAVLEQQIAAKEKDLEEAKNSTFSAELTDTTDRRAVHDLALRLSIGLLRGKALNITVDDIEMLRTI